MKRAIAYARFSSDLQRSESIDAQVRAIKKYCEANDFVLLAVYADKGISGTSDNRPEFQRMIAEASKSKVDAVIVHKLDRFARNRYDSAFYKNILKKSNVRLISVLENLQDTPESVILESVIEGMNEYYSLNLSREVRKGLQENALECKVTGGPPALGYSVDPNTKKYVINPYEAEAVKLIFKMYLDGYSYTEIIDTLNSKGYKTRKGVAFAKNSLHCILKNERYTGVYVYVKDATKNPKGKYVRHGEYEPDAVIRIPGGIPAIISEDDFKKVQIKMRERQHKAAKFSAKQEYLLSGKIYCGECGSPFAGNSRKPRPDHPLYVSYKCTKRNQTITTCKNREINRDKLEKVVLEKLSAELFNPEIIPVLVNKYNEYLSNKNSDANNRLASLRKQLKEVERKISNTVNLMVETGSLAFKNKLSELEADKEKLTYELSEIESTLQNQIISEKELTKLFIKAEKQLKTGKLSVRRIIIDQYVDKVVIFQDKIEIYLKLASDYIFKETVKSK